MKITTGIASTTHVDRQRERLSKSALHSMSMQIKETYIPNLINHDWSQQVGVILYGEVFQLDDGEYALGVVSGKFESESERESFQPGQTNTAWQRYMKYLNIDRLRMLSASNSGDAGVKSKEYAESVAGRLEKYLDSTGVMPNGTVYRTKLLVTGVNDLRIEVYPHDHAPEHFHVTSRQRGIDARFSMSTLKLLSVKRGRISQSDVRKVQAYFDKNPQELEALVYEHRRLNPGQS